MVNRQVKAILTPDAKVAYFSPDGDPLWFSIGKGEDDLIPTGTLHSCRRIVLVPDFALCRDMKVYTLWKKYDLLPYISSPASVMPVLAGGADLMIPGGMLFALAAGCSSSVFFCLSKFFYSCSDFIADDRTAPISCHHTVY